MTEKNQEINNNDKAQGKLKFLVSQLARMFGMRTQEISNNEIRSQIQRAIDSLDRPTQPYHYVNDVFDDYFVYEAISDNGGWGDTKLFKQKYEIVDNAVSLLGEREEIEQERTNEPVTNQEKRTTEKGGETLMEIKKLIDQLISNEATLWTEEERPWLETATKETLEKMLPETKDVPEEPEKPVVNESTEPEPKIMTVEEFISQAPKEIGETLTEAMAMRAEEKTALIKGILANKKNEFTEQELTEMPQSQLRKLGALNQVDASYVGQGGSPFINQEEPMDLPQLPTFN